MIKYNENSNIPSPQQIREKRKSVKLSQSKAAELVKRKLRAWQTWEYGQCKMPEGLWELFKIKCKKIKEDFD
jgi:DNA-binding transcriptional regulator YiaG